MRGGRQGMLRRPPPTAEQIANAESVFGAKLPDAYLEFLAFSNGGRPMIGWVPSSTTVLTCGFGVDFFFYLSAQPHELFDVVWAFNNRFEKARSGILVPIAEADHGDQVYLNLTVPGEAPVMFTRHDPMDSPILRVADSFEALIDSLCPFPDDDD
jgi:hypothetical protein